MRINKPLYYLLIVLLVAYGCSNTKYLPEGEMLYVGGEVTVKDSLIKKKERKAMEKELEALLRPKTNSAFLGLRFKLYIYNLAGEPKKEKGFKHWLRTKVGEPPVLFSQVDLDYNADILQNYAENKGYFKTRTTADSTSNNRRAKALYTVTTGKQYLINKVTFPDSTGTQLDSVIGRMSRRSLLKKGQPYDLDVIKSERERIDARLKNKGYFYFNPDYLIIQVDSTIGKYEVNLKVKVKDDTPEVAKNVYTINNIFIYPNYSLTSKDSVVYPASAIQEYKDFKIIDTANTFRPIIYDRTMFFHKGDIYSRRDHNLSLNRLVNLGPFKFVKNDFHPSDSVKNALDAYYYFTPLTRKSIRIETLGKTNSANYNGSEVNVNWINRNTFRAAELLTLTVFGGLEIQASGQNKGYNVYRVGTEASLVWPRFISPIRIQDSSAYVPRTKALLSYEYQNRQKLYSLNSSRAQFGYLWKDNIRTEHQLFVADINYVSSTNVTPEYQMQADTVPSLQRVIDKQLIFGPTYSYTFTNTMQKRKKHTFYYKGSLDLAGTLAGLVTGANVKKGDTINLFSVPFSQFVKMEHDFRHYLKLSDNSQLASRIIAGVGMPYGNSGILPYIRQFFIGGTNSIRAFRARSIGPGTYRNDELDANAFLPDQSGDLKLEINTEYRAKLFSVVHGAVFVDAGNIWLWNKDPDRPGAQFSSKFLNELAVGTGAGLRFDLSFLVLRLDLAFPLRKPWLPEGERWVLGDIDFGSGAWRKENLVFNIAIGYPF
ncbi:translocation and assembly module lipoprotein TamL [Flavobacterium subsaxonicum]|uniref:Surface antigen (D15) n=1 Tax=Flavobacterium subsaxonicum WB 4.1-42 = DSM 21790 TaxID=1121898 RepID=A0A0A2MKD4_9FLAO|nr:BamA/TamA family outer membrane protein [Flavobacterium subsaxonicum]KGO91953.1 surface antigen (D15) [Flavobacterium subsaxonicum WB 4.1-42 = DSM 21790]